ncbi:Fic/DOC family protein [Candidatus Rariloculus sp.]|uniref:Fic/DOC family protein n=1 Tax=Candidatus Rariloculus sp. TaxID=3101265 RepID=UPI003D0CB4E0
MTGRYDTTGNIEAQFEPGSCGRVLANKLGISEPEEMNDVELDLLNRLHESVIDSVEADQPVTVADVREWHRRWLGNVYVWAGRYRTVNMGKGDFQFAASGQIPRLMDNLDKEFLPVHTPCTGMSEDQLTEAIAIVHVELILIHPFREGNGRLSRLLANVMALQAGWPELDYTPWDDCKTDYFASIQAGMSDYVPMKRLVKRVLRESARSAND